MHWWNHANLSTFVKVVLLLLGLFLLIFNSHWLVPMGIALGAVYLVYFGVRSLVLASNRPATAKPPSAPAAAAV